MDAAAGAGVATPLRRGHGDHHSQGDRPPAAAPRRQSIWYKPCAAPPPAPLLRQWPLRRRGGGWASRGAVPPARGLPVSRCQCRRRPWRPATPAPRTPGVGPPARTRRRPASGRGWRVMVAGDGCHRHPAARRPPDPLQGGRAPSPRSQGSAGALRTIRIKWMRRRGPG